MRKRQVKYPNPLEGDQFNNPKTEVKQVEIESLNGISALEAQRRYEMDQAEYEKTCREEYARYTSHLWQQRRDSEADADKLVLSLSTAILGLSATFVKDVVPYVYVWSLWILISSWFFLGGSIIFTLFSYHLSRKSIDDHIEASIPYFFENKKDAFEEVNQSKKSTEKFNNFSSSAFVLGLILLLLFVEMNLKEIRHNMATEKQTTNLERGTTPPPAPKLPNPPSQAVQTPTPATQPAKGGNTSNKP